jgi:thymidylate synthase (FAD)
MQVKLVSYTKSVDNENKSLQDLIAYCARVSNPSNQNNNDTNDKLINYLIRNNHWSPFEMVNVCIEIETTRDIIRQILRHRSFSFQEFSQRYAVADLGFEYKEARLQDTKNRQNSIEIKENGDLENEWLKNEWLKNEWLKNEWLEKQKNISNFVQETYDWALLNGIAKEQARAVLPEGITLSKIYMNGTLRSWIHYIELRSGNGTQKEHRDVAIACANVIDTIFPISKIIKQSN